MDWQKVIDRLRKNGEVAQFSAVRLRQQPLPYFDRDATQRHEIIRDVLLTLAASLEAGLEKMP